MRRAVDFSDRPTSEQLDRELHRVEASIEARKAIWSAVKTLLVFAAIAIMVSNLWLPAYRVQSGSMEPTLRDGDILVAVTPAGIRRGDIIAFNYNNQGLIKRVIAMDGDVVDIDAEGAVSVNGEPLTEPYVTELDLGNCTIKLPYQVPIGQYFVIGDNRVASLDSRDASFGTLRREQITGRALVRVWPMQKIGLIAS